MSQPNFEQMSNDELRQKMEEFGLPNVPITASTRHILIKRLHNHLNGGAATGKASAAAANKARRETMHVVKYSSDEESDRDVAKEKLKKKLENHKNARRQTIGGAALSPALAPAPAPAPAALEKSSRKSMRATPTKTTRESGIQPPTRHIVKTIPVTIEDSDEEEVIQAPPPRKAADRRSKSKTPVTLGKSDLVTTSYKQVVAPVREEEPIELEDDEEQSDLEDMPLATRYSPRKYEVNEPAAPTMYSPVKPMSIRISPLRRTTTAGGAYRYESGLSKPDSVTSTSYTRPSLAPTSYSSSYSNQYSSGSSAVASGGDGGGTGNDEEFPYLREFSKRLSTLKAEPLYKRNVPMSTSATSRTTTSYSSSRASNYRPVIQREAHWYDSAAQFMARLEEKYALKKKILIWLAILVVVFVVVMVWY